MDRRRNGACIAVSGQHVRLHARWTTSWNVATKRWGAVRCGANYKRPRSAAGHRQRAVALSTEQDACQSRGKLVLLQVPVGAQCVVIVASGAAVCQQLPSVRRSADVFLSVDATLPFRMKTDRQFSRVASNRNSFSCSPLLPPSLLCVCVGHQRHVMLFRTGGVVTCSCRCT